MLEEHYKPCWNADAPYIEFRWAGFLTDNQKLCKDGWLSRCLYNKYQKIYKLRFHHPYELMTFQFNLVSILDLHERTLLIYSMNVGGKKNDRPMLISNHWADGLDATDVPTLLSMVTQLQEPIRKKQVQEAALPEAQVFDIAKYMRTALGE